MVTSSLLNGREDESGKSVIHVIILSRLNRLPVGMVLILRHDRTEIVKCERQFRVNTTGESVCDGVMSRISAVEG